VSRWLEIERLEGDQGDPGIPHVIVATRPIPDDDKHADTPRLVTGVRGLRPQPVLLGGERAGIGLRLSQ
jgi:hypothetical protein